MISAPDRYLEPFVRAGADRLTVHVETCDHLHRTIQRIRELGAKPGVTLNPGTPLSSLEAILPDVDLVLVMSVNPGFGGQSYISRSTERIGRLRAMLDEMGSEAEIEVDGGINPDTVVEVVKAGATVLVAGTAIFGGRASVQVNVQLLRERYGRG
jgi:ribulose-phosphate 3-epimerase